MGVSDSLLHFSTLLQLTQSPKQYKGIHTKCINFDFLITELIDINNENDI